MTAEDPEISKELKGDKRHVLLTSWAAVATALFLFILILGAVYVVNIKGKFDEVTVNIENVDTNEEEIIQRNTNKHTEFIIKKTIEGYIELVAGINYNTKISSVYLPKENICVLSTGEDMDWYEDMSENQKADVNERGEYDTYVYTLTMPSKVTDLTLLTSEMQVFCRGKDMYWADKKEQEEEHGLANREKRDDDIGCYWFYYYICCKNDLELVFQNYCAATDTTTTTRGRG